MLIWISVPVFPCLIFPFADIFLQLFLLFVHFVNFIFLVILFVVCVIFLFISRASMYYIVVYLYLQRSLFTSSSSRNYINFWSSRWWYRFLINSSCNIRVSNFLSLLIYVDVIFLLSLLLFCSFPIKFHFCYQSSPLCFPLNSDVTVLSISAL